VKSENVTNLDTLSTFIGNSQRQAIKSGLRGEERAHFAQMLAGLTEQINAMPKTYEQDGKGDAAVVHLHYFTGAADWFITEKDLDHDGEGQHQAFGLADIFHDGGDMGYISITEILEAGAELDFYWTPATLGEIKEKRTKVEPVAQTRLPWRAEEFRARLYTLAKARRAKADDANGSNHIFRNT